MFDWLINKFGWGIGFVILGVFLIIAALAGEFNLWLFTIPLTKADLRMYVGLFGTMFVIFGVLARYFGVDADFTISDWFQSPTRNKVAVTKNMKTDSKKESVERALVSVKGLSVSYRVDAIRSIAPSLPRDISGFDAGRILGSLSVSYRLEAIEILAPKIKRKLSAAEQKAILGNLSGSYRRDAIEILARR